MHDSLAEPQQLLISNLTRFQSLAARGSVMTMPSLKWSCHIAVLLVVCATLGCGRSDRPRFHKVQGKVTLDGEPLAEATLTFERISGDQMEFARPSICISGADGTFAPWTMMEGDGLPAGKYRVGVFAQKQVGGPPLTAEMTDAEYARIKWKSVVPAKYNVTTTSGIEIEVTASGMEPDVIALTSK
jgi:hypothetical protein